MKYERYQILPEMETSWKLEYLNKKISSGVNITKYVERGLIDSATQLIVFCDAMTPSQMDHWLASHACPEIIRTLDQAIRRRRKRYFNNEKLTSQRKILDIDYSSWLALSQYAKLNNVTMSQAIMDLLIKTGVDIIELLSMEIPTKVASEEVESEENETLLDLFEDQEDRA